MTRSKTFFLCTAMFSLTAGSAHAEDLGLSGMRTTGFTPPAMAENDGDWEISIGAGPFFKPEFEGSEDYELTAFPYFNINYKDRVKLDISGLNVNAIKTENFKLGAGVGADFGRDEDDSGHLEGLGDIDPTLEGRLFAEYTYDKVSAGLTFAQDLGDGHEGYTLEAEAGYAMMLPAWQMFVKPQISTTYASDDYMQSYFGVNQTQAARSALRRFDSESGFKDVSASVFASRPLSKHWSLNALVQYSRLVGDAADSPVTQDENQFSGGLFAAYKF